jgi:hypothetical protein
MNVKRELLQRSANPPLELTGAEKRSHLRRFWSRWKMGYPIAVPKTMFMGISGRKIGLFPTSPAVYWHWKTWLHPHQWSDALVFVVVCDNSGDPLPDYGWPV